MKIYLATSCAILATLLGASVAATAQDSHSDTARAATYVKDSAITTKIKTREAADEAVSIARSTAHVKGAHSELKVVRD
jgi:hyperosmotically inducible periplasmic protein